MFSLLLNISHTFCISYVHNCKHFHMFPQSEYFLSKYSKNIFFKYQSSIPNTFQTQFLSYNIFWSSDVINFLTVDCIPLSIVSLILNSTSVLLIYSIVFIILVKYRPIISGANWEDFGMKTILAPSPHLLMKINNMIVWCIKHIFITFSWKL